MMMNHTYIRIYGVTVAAMALIILASSYTRLTRLNDEQVLSIDREVYDLDDVLVLTIQNVYGDSILVDVDCRIQVWTGGYWRELNTDSTDSGYDAAAKVLAPGETYRQIVNLRRLGEGRYRIGKQITHLEEQTNMFWIEFQIEG